MAFGESEATSRDSAEAAKRQRLLASLVVHSANATMRELGCSGSLSRPGNLTAVPDYETVGNDRTLCGIKDVILPRKYVGSGARERRSVGENGPVRSCDIATGRDPLPRLRLKTVQESDLTEAFTNAVLKQGKFFTYEKPSDDTVSVNGNYSATQAAVRIACKKHTAVFIAQDEHSTGGHTFIADVFPAYVSAESERLGCGPVKIRAQD